MFSYSKDNIFLKIQVAKTSILVKYFSSLALYN
jgi:hypothetical protein